VTIDASGQDSSNRRSAKVASASRVGRRRILSSAALGAAGFSAWALTGCSSSNSNNSNTNSSSAAATRAGSTAAAGASQQATAAGAARSAATPSSSSGSVSISQASLDVQQADPMLQLSGVEAPIVYAETTALYYEDVTGKFVPGVADSIESSPDGMSFVIKVHPGIKFVNDMPLSADDVKFSIDRMISTSFVKAQWAMNIDHADIVDPQTVKVTMKTIAPAWLFNIQGLYTLPKAYIASLGDGDFAPNAYQKAPIGVGPYKLTENKINSYVQFQAYDGYFLGAPRTKQVRINVVPELTTRIAQLQAGETDIIHGLLADNLQAIKGISGASTVSSQGAGGSELTFFDMMKSDSPFADVRVRQAINHAIDRKSILTNLYQGQAILENSLCVKFPSTIGYDPALANTEPFPYDVKTAKDLLAAAGFPNGFTTEITTYDTPTTPGTPQMMQAVSDDLSKVGIKAPVRMMDAGQYVGLFNHHMLTGMGPISFGGVIQDFATTYQIHYLAGAPYSYDNWPDGDDLYNKIQAEIDANKRQSMSQQLLKMLSRDRVPNVPLLATNSIIAIGPKVKAYPQQPGQPYISDIHLIELK
jgi:peptide/nickel transport system substrate-binding protein